MSYFEYGEKEIEYLKQKDKKLGEAIDKIGMVKRKVNSDVFAVLISSILSQQISTKAAVTVENRVIELIGDITPANIHNTELESIQKCGMSLRKANYIKGVAEAAISKAVDFENFHNLTDKEVIKELIQLKGVGEWTAEMLLIHSLQRPNILSYKDLGIRGGIAKLHDLKELSRKDFGIYQSRYTPYCTVASIYLWKLY